LFSSSCTCSMMELRALFQDVNLQSNSLLAQLI
jgi:hypothetical protein